MASGQTPQGEVDRIVLREGRGVLSGKVAAIDRGGVAMRMVRADGQADEASTLKIVAWDRVLRVEGAGAAGVGGAAGTAGTGGAAGASKQQVLSPATIADLSDAMWRARSRLERGDALGAESLLADRAADFAGEKGPTAAAVYDGLLRCRLARGARAGAVSAWLSWLGVMERSEAMTGPERSVAIPAEWMGGVIEGAPVVDLRTGLSPALPPIWVNEPALGAAATAGDWTRAGGGVVEGAAGAKKGLIAAELARWYELAARFEESGSVEASSLPKQPAGSAGSAGTGGSEGARVVQFIVQARVGDAAQRAQAREALRGLIPLETTEPWLEAWCRAGIGRSLVREAESGDRLRGVIELLHVPARLSSASPMLASVCLAEAAVVMHELGEVAAAASLKQELLANFPEQVAAGWSRLASIPSPEKRASPAETPEREQVPDANAASSNGGTR